ncbi:hypothetical protein ABZX98_08885 [Streptomyces sp. NPDC002992]|uniref:hypothetical protein n=1 Tax=Streptomyces sp. NPDC002992 TaxID=3154273 RepID=UPI0033A27AB6
MTSSRLGRLVAAATLVGLLGACSPAPDSRESRHQEWDKKAGAPEAAAFMKVDLPAGATEVKGARQLNVQDDSYLLSFTTTPKAAEVIGKQFEGQAPLEERAPLSTPIPPGTPFAHLGLPEPDTLQGVRWAGVCPPCVKDKQRKHIEWIEIYLQKLDADRTRVYLRAW